MDLLRNFPTTTRCLLVLTRPSCKPHSVSASLSLGIPKQPRSISIRNFESWLKELGHNPGNLKLKEIGPKRGHEGYGAVAGEGGIKRGDVTVSVPREAFMNAETALACRELAPLLERHNLSPWQALCLHLLWERNLGSSSFWHPYIDMLPLETEIASSHPLLWTEENRLEWIAGSPLLQELEQQLQLVKEDTEALLSTGVNKLAPAGKTGAEIVSEGTVRWAAAILLSRAFALDLHSDEFDSGLAGDTVLTLVPWADMLNHSSEAGDESCLVYNPETKSATLRAHKNYSAGQQVFDSYGPRLTPGKLFLDYGFVDEANENHAMELPVSLLGAVAGPANEALLKAVDLPSDGAMFPLMPSGADTTVMAWTRAALASEIQLRKAGWLESSSGKRRPQERSLESRAAMAMSYFSQPVSRQNEIKALSRLQAAAKAALARYPTSLEYDQEALACGQLPHNGKMVPLQWAHQQALRAVRSEKLVLTGALEAFKETLNRLRQSESFRK